MIVNLQNIKGHCYKLLIYGKDGHFLQHRDTQKLDGMFATLIIQLPCKYEVVDNKPILTVKHKDYVYNYYFGSNTDTIKQNNYDCEYNIYYAAHYCDLMHEINKIKSGIRMAVTYNICWEGPKNIMPSISNIDKIATDIDNVLKSWDPTDRCPIAIKLDHLYTDMSYPQTVNALKLMILPKCIV